jgi:hypothetical protein
MTEKPEQWVELAEMASKEQDPERLMALAAEINRLLEKKQNPTKDEPLKPTEE